MSLMDDSVSIVATAISLVMYRRASVMLQFSKISISGRSQGDTQFYLCQTAQFSLYGRGLGSHVQNVFEIYSEIKVGILRMKFLHLWP